MCSRVPAHITESGIFIVDFAAVSHKDLKVDENRVYGAHFSPSEDFQVFFDNQGKVSALTRIYKNDNYK